MATPADLARIQSYQYPAAHVGHLAPAQESALGDFKLLCEQKGYFSPAEPGVREVPTHDDETLLRYLRARKFNPTEAFGQFKDTEDWRKDNKLEELYDTIDLKSYEETRKLYPQWTGRRDRRGIPVYLFEVAPLNTKATAAYDKSIANSIKNNPQAAASATTSATSSPKMLRLFALYENLTRFVLPLCSAIPGREYPETPVSQSNNIVDISKVGLKQFWNLKSHMQDASTLATAHYPETLDRIFIIGAPTFFPTVWGWIKRWFDPITVSKIFILTSANTKSTLEQYIDPANIPSQYGGTLEYAFGDPPNLEPAIQQQLTWDAPSTFKSRNTFPTGPIRWDEGPKGEMLATAVGTEGDGPKDAKPRKLVVARLEQPFRAVTKPVNRPVEQLARLHTGAGTETHPVIDEGAGEEERPDFGSSDSSEVVTPAGGLEKKGITEAKPEEAGTGTKTEAVAANPPDSAVGTLKDGEKLEVDTPASAPAPEPSKA